MKQMSVTIFSTGSVLTSYTTVVGVKFNDGRMYKREPISCTTTRHLNSEGYRNAMVVSEEEMKHLVLLLGE